MKIRDWVNKVFTKSTEPPQRRKDDPVNLAAAARDQAERETATALDQKLAELMRHHQTPELTPHGTRPKTPPNEEQARRLAEKLVMAAKEQAPSNENALPKKRYRLKDGAEAKDDAPTLREEAAQRGFAATLQAIQAQRAAKEKVPSNENDPGRKWLDGSPTEPEAFEAYREDIEAMTAQHDSAEAAHAQPTARPYSPDDDAAEISAEHSAREAREAAQHVNGHDEGRSMGRSDYL